MRSADVPEIPVWGLVLLGAVGAVVAIALLAFAVTTWAASRRWQRRQDREWETPSRAVLEPAAPEPAAQDAVRAGLARIRAAATPPPRTAPERAP
jgi:hypothetical protein